MTFPSGSVPVPAVVLRFAVGRPVRAVWVNGEGGTTFQVGAGTEFVAGNEFIKVADAGATGFAGEARRLRWAARYVTVPAVLGTGTEPGGGAWLRTRGLPGLSAVHPRWSATPEVAVRAIGTGARPDRGQGARHQRYWRGHPYPE